MQEKSKKENDESMKRVEKMASKIPEALTPIFLGHSAEETLMAMSIAIIGLATSYGFPKDVQLEYHKLLVESIKFEIVPPE